MQGRRSRCSWPSPSSARVRSVVRLLTLVIFRQEFVVRRRWLEEEAYAGLLALCQLWPGHASSQVGFSLGLMHVDYLGGLGLLGAALYNPVCIQSSVLATSASRSSASCS
jgi:chromate transport protein ChrA